MKARRILAGAAGAVALAFLLSRTGVSAAAIQPQRLGLVVLMVVITGGLRLWLQTKAWQLALGAEKINVPHSRLTAVRLASQATGYMAAMGALVSEPAKLMLLRNTSGMVAAAPATLFETGMYWFTTVVLGLAGTAAAALLMSGSPMLWAATAVFGVGLVLLLDRRSVLFSILSCMPSRGPKWLRSAAQVEQQIRSWRDTHRSAAKQILVLECVGQLLTLAEVAAVLWVSGIRFSVLHVLAIEAGTRIIKIGGAWIPGRIGADEGGAMGSFALLGLAPHAGLTLALARRIRDLLWCSAGVAWMVRSASGRDNETPLRSSLLAVRKAA